MSRTKRTGKKRDLLVRGLGSVLAMHGETYDSYKRRVVRRKKRLDPHHVAVEVENFRAEAIRNNRPAILGLYADMLAVGTNFSRAFHQVVTKY